MALKMETLWIGGIPISWGEPIAPGVARKQNKLSKLKAVLIHIDDFLVFLRRSKWMLS